MTSWLILIKLFRFKITKCVAMHIVPENNKLQTMEICLGSAKVAYAWGSVSCNKNPPRNCCIFYNIYAYSGEVTMPVAQRSIEVNWLDV